MIIKNGIKSAIGKDAALFCTPGHNGGGEIPLYFDVTEIDGTDNLQNPHGIIKEAQQSAAAVFGADKTFFLVNGSSMGIHALIMSLCSRGDTLIIDRACHISVINAVVLNDIRPVFIYPEFDMRFGINTIIKPNAVENAFKQHPNAKGVLITSPNYYGICSDIGGIAGITHKYNAELIVDEAHGAHFSFNKLLPAPSLACGADGVVQSTHKTLPCITQGALLHIKGTKLNAEKIRENINLLQTTSPSYLIMMSIDEAVANAVKFPEDKLKTFILRCMRLKEKINSAKGLRCVGNGDATRIVINAGQNADKINLILKKRYGIISEMCDGKNIVFIAKLFFGLDNIERLENALFEICGKLQPYKEVLSPPPVRLDLALAPAKAYYSKTEKISPQLAANRISARPVYKLPPGMCIIAPGEVISSQAAALLSDDIYVVDKGAAQA